MTKEERLQELKIEKKVYKEFDKYFDAGWKEFVKNIHARHDIANARTFRILSKLKGTDFVSDLKKLMGKKNKSALLEFSKKPKGMRLKDSRFETIPELMMNIFPSGSYRQGEVYVQFRHDRWVYFVF